METVRARQPGRDEARAMLEMAERAEGETRNPPLPRGFFVAQAALLAAVCGVQVLPAGPSGTITIIGLVAAAGLGARWVFLRPGYGVVWPDGRAVFPYLVAMFVLVGVPAVLAIAVGAPWLWYVAGAMAAGTTLEMGRRYRRMFERA